MATALKAVSIVAKEGVASSYCCIAEARCMLDCSELRLESALEPCKAVVGSTTIAIRGCSAD